MPFAEVNDVRLFYTDDGSGDPPILFIHGYSCDSHDWSWQLPYFAARHRVVAVDLRGHGYSSAPEEGYDHLTFAADLAGLIDHLGTGPVVAAGHSMGGIIVSALAVEYPQLVGAVVAVDPAYLIPDDFKEGLEALVAAVGGPDPVPAAQAVLGGAPSPATPPALFTWHTRRIAGMAPHVLRQALTSNVRGMTLASNSAPYLARRRCPVLALYADPSRAAVERALFTDERSRAVSFEGSGHWLHQECPAEVNSVVDAWLSSLALGG